MKNLWMLLLFLMLTSGCSKTSDMRVWTSGSDTVEAKFVGMTEDGQEVILENKDGEQASIPLTRLSQKDQNWVKEHSPSADNSFGEFTEGKKNDGLGTGTKAGEKKTVTIKGINYTFCWCPPGTFMMGSPESEKDRNDVDTQHKVTLTKGFWLLEHEVTQEMWKSVKGDDPSEFKGDTLPVEKVSGNDCKEFIRKLQGEAPAGMEFRLPTEAEWEYACRAGTTTVFSFGNSLNGDKANCDGNKPYGTNTKGPSLEKTTPVMTYSPNPWGLYDMHGNVEEWCEDWLGDYPSGSVTDPKGPKSGSDRICRGGGWDSYAEYCRSACRHVGYTGDRRNNRGFRLALSSTR